MTGEPRIAPLPVEDWPDELASVRQAVTGGSGTSPRAFNIFKTFARNPELFRAWLPFGQYLLGEGRLPARDRELLILRTAVRCGSSYEWGQHVRIAERLEIERADIDRVAAGPDADGWSEHEAALLRCADELHEGATVSPATWSALRARYDEPQMMEATMLVGQYHMVAFALNAFGVQLDEGLEGLPGAGS